MQNLIFLISAMKGVWKLIFGQKTRVQGGNCTSRAYFIHNREFILDLPGVLS